MIKDLEQLILLAKINKEIDTFLPRIGEINASLESKQNEIDSVEAKAKKAQTEIDDLKTQIVHTNAKIAEFKAKIASAGKKSGSVKNEREAAALVTEEDLARDRLDAANEDIEKYERMIANKTSILGELNEKLEALRGEFSQLSEASAGEIERIESTRARLVEQKERIASESDQKLVVFYDKIRKWAKDTAIVPVRKQACYGCFMKINDVTHSAVLRGEEILTCPHCGRILYKEASVEEVAQSVSEE